jgi:hypothetical protein
VNENPPLLGVSQNIQQDHTVTVDADDGHHDIEMKVRVMDSHSCCYNFHDRYYEL